MFAAHLLRHATRRARLVLAAGVLAAAGTVAAPPALGAVSPFAPGDVFLLNTNGLQEYSPSGQLVQNIPGTSAATGFCFDPSGRRLILPGVGLMNDSGQVLASNWATVPFAANESRCVADGSGHVYLVGSTGIDQYSITGHLLMTFAPAGTGALIGIPPHALAIAPDDCTIYYGAWEDVNGIDRFNVCTNTQDPVFDPTNTVVDDLAVIPTGQVMYVTDSGAGLYDTAGVCCAMGYPSPFDPANNLRTMSLDPDGTSVWLSSPGAGVARYDIASGQLLSEWGEVIFPTPTDPTPPPPVGGSIAVYAPPLLGDANVAPRVDTLAPGTAQAFAAHADYSGSLTGLHLYVDATSTASQVLVGVYSDAHGRPGALQAQATIAAPLAGSWNEVSIPALALTSGERYWIAVLAPAGRGRLSVRIKTGDGSAEMSARATLCALPAAWGPGFAAVPAHLSAYGNGAPTAAQAAADVRR